ncbi:MAG: RnfABCDGE type electron transport complex subunit D [Clostridia bacterium]|nr:RnfABCDGE type electron transport complex subunit D [Clostridia bacterium]
MSKLNISISPHIKSSTTTTHIMLDVIIALIPALIASVVLFGMRSLLVTAFCVAVCVVSQFVFEKLCKMEVAVGDLSAVVTGMLLAFNLPVTVPLWQAAVGCLVAIIVVKELFGGIGHNFANPAITARIVMLLAFSGSMSSWAAPIVSDADLTSSATTLSVLKEGTVEGLPSIKDMLLGVRAGSLGETCAVALIIGGIYLIARKVIMWHTPVFFIGGVFVLTFALSGFDAQYALYQVLSGGVLIGAIFMATDYVTSPPTALGKVIFGLGCAVLTVVIRLYGTNPEGVSFAILLMNILSPTISNLTRRKVFGAKKLAKGGNA